MTDKEIDNFERSYANGDTDDERQHNEALDMAIKALEQQMIISEELLNRLNERKMSIPISETYTEDHKVGWKDGIFWSDVLEIFEELEGTM